MADDGMILNFSLGDAPLKPQVRKIQGGKWRDRLKAQRSAKRGIESTSSASPSSSLNAKPTIVIGKRQGISLSEQSHQQPSPHPRPSGPSGNVTSRLFTSNPTARTVFDDEPKTEEEPAEPSNAPLSEEAASFHALGISRRLAQTLSGKVQLKAPTAIQAKVIPQLISDDSDAFVQAQTGSGKTLAYLLPVLQRILSVEGQLRRDSGLFAIVMAPTRELCRQIDVVLAKLLPPWLVSTTVIGGESKHSEKSRIRKGVNILIATPGRLTDHLEHTKALDVGTVRWLVLDEGDRLMEMGFEEDLREIVAKIREKPLDGKTKNGVSLKGLPTRRVTVLCSATMKMDVQKLGEISLKDAVHISTSEDDGKDEAKGKGEGEVGGEGDRQVVFSAPAQLKQSFYIVPAKLRLVTLISLLKATFLRRGSVMKAIVFISCADSVDFHFDLLKQPASSNAENATKPSKTPDSSSSSTSLTANTVAPAAYLGSPANPNIVLHKLHGSLPQPVRTATLGAYSKCEDPCVLITTDISSRGLDVPSVELVIEYDPAFSSDDHLHRIGRTARAGRPGKAVLFLQPGCEEGYVDHLAAHAGSSSSTPPKAESYEGVLHSGLSQHMPFPVDTDAKPVAEDSRSFSQRAEALQLHLEQRLLSPGGKGLLEAARKAFRSHVRAYATHTKAERKYFDIQELHLGHTAKSYALREAPTGVGRGGAKEGKKAALKEAARKKRKHGGKARDEEEGGDDGVGAADEDEEARERERKMRMKMKSVMDAAGEFNIG
ncbi:hypothetical protein ACRALDRAFT_1045766 [Sodiomyces alcalophilus JCM 7366]|uniref:uncharacterized protein n=1 Tax=Sodiomyces alcalophilus JCM 7366 TaxID=591952 RepID=UPI0039B6AB0F